MNYLNNNALTISLMSIFGVRELLLFKASYTVVSLIFEDFSLKLLIIFFIPLILLPQGVKLVVWYICSTA